MNNDEQRDHLDEQHTRAELEAEGLAELEAEEELTDAERIAAGFVMVGAMAALLNPRSRIGAFLGEILDMIPETGGGGRVPFARPHWDTDEPPYLDPAELPDWTRDCPFNVVQSIQLTDEVPF